MYIFNDFHNYHINFISLGNIFDDSDIFLSRLKAGATPGWPPLWEEVDQRYLIGNLILILTIHPNPQTCLPAGRSWF